MKNVETSIIIRTYNEGKHLARLLDAVLSQDYRDWEIIIVDSGSTDDTLEIARKYPVKMVNIPKEKFTFGYSLNVGCKNALGSYLVLVSAHTYPLNNKWLGNMVKPFEDLRVGMVYGRQIGNEITKVSEAKDMLLNFGEKSKILVEESFGNNANAAIRKSLWNKIPYDEKLPGIEDIDWAHKIQKNGFYVYYRADAVIFHIHDETYSQIYNRFKRESIAYKTIFPDYPYEAGKTAIVYALAVLKDIYFGFTKKMPLRKILTAVPYRIAEYKGWRDGYYQEGNFER
ncbi:MAG: glycosyltransferase family A protein [Syntrophaceae bacterium]